MSDEMRRCPFCGELERLFNGYASGVRQCLVCGATALAKDWNTRPVEDELWETIRKLQECCRNLRKRLCDCGFYPDCRPHCRAYALETKR